MRDPYLGASGSIYGQWEHSGPSSKRFNLFVSQFLGFNVYVNRCLMCILYMFWQNVWPLRGRQLCKMLLEPGQWMVDAKSRLYVCVLTPKVWSVGWLKNNTQNCTIQFTRQRQKVRLLVFWSRPVSFRALVQTGLWCCSLLSLKRPKCWRS